MSDKHSFQEDLALILNNVLENNPNIRKSDKQTTLRHTTKMIIKNVKNIFSEN